MNFDDFSYEENGRRYLDPQLALDEENAFIQRLRDTQGQRNAQIARQTNGLGKNVPTNLGSLNGSEAYFNARYQTPQTNSLVGDLRAAAQATALNTAINNEITKANKLYKDAYYAAKERERAATGTGEKALTRNELRKELGITSPGAEETEIKQNDEDKNTIGDLGYENGHNIYTIWNGKKYVLGNVPFGVALTAPFMNSSSNWPNNGTVVDYNGAKYLFVNTEKSGGPKWFKILMDTDGNIYK